MRAVPTKTAKSAEAPPQGKAFTSLTEEIRAVLSHASRPLSTKELMDACMTAESVTAVAGCTNRMWMAGELQRSTNLNNRFVYEINSRFEPSTNGRQRVGCAKPAPASAPAPAEAPEPALAPPPEPPAAPPNFRCVVRALDGSEKPAPRPPGGYSLFDHIAHALADCDDLVIDAINHDASLVIVKHLLAGVAGLRKAQEAVVRAQLVARA